MKSVVWQLYLSVILSVCLGNANDYKDYYLEDPDLCSAAGLKQGKIKLDRSAYSAAQLLNKRSKSNFLCRIKVKTASKTDGVVAVVQELALRRNESTGECIDYVQLVSEEGIPSKKFCGTFDAEWKMDPMFIEPHLLDMPVRENTFVNKIGNYLTVDIFISKGDWFRDETQTIIKIVFTLFTICKFNLDEFVPCREADYICIRPWYFEDGIINCPYPGCVDEGGCRVQPANDEQMSIRNKVIISSMSSLVISFIVFVICIYLCRKYKKLCWSENFSNPHPTAPPEVQAPRVMEMHEQPSQPEQQPNRNLEKDLPPSYESLFPDR